MKTAHRFLALLVCLGMLSARLGVVRAQEQDSKFFPETGHWVSGEFWKFYNRFPEPELLFGYPITRMFVTTTPAQLTVQYFQRARFELHPELPEGQRVQLTPIGSTLYQPGAPSLNLSTPGACRPFATGYSVCYDFLTFFDQYGGGLFGNPISGFEFQPDGRIVQYFERAEFEWHPEMPAGQNIVLVNLGQLYFEKIGEDESVKGPEDSNGLARLLSLRTFAFVWKAVTLPTDQQTIFVVVQDQTLQPVNNATVVVNVRLPSGEEKSYAATTDVHGIAIIQNVTFENQPYGSLAEVLANVQIANLSTDTTTSFRIWR